MLNDLLCHQEADTSSLHICLVIKNLTPRIKDLLSHQENDTLSLHICVVIKNLTPQAYIFA